ncbi:MAG: hypothetical protein AAFO96_03480 [Bacteroidota bacterium]
MLTSEYIHQYDKLVKLLQTEFKKENPGVSTSPTSWGVLNGLILTFEGIKAKFYSSQDPKAENA